MFETTGAWPLAPTKEEDIFLIRNAAHHVSQGAHDALGVISDLLLVEIALADEDDVVRNASHLELRLLPVVAAYDRCVDEGVVVGRLIGIWLRPGFKSCLRLPGRRNICQPE